MMLGPAFGIGRRGPGPRRFTFLVFGLILACLAGAAAPAVRTWTDGAGKYKIQAKFVSEKDGKVTLEKPDGSEIEIELKKLSAADRTYVAEAGQDNPFKPASADPFKPKEKGAAKKAEGPAVESAVVVPDWSGVREVEATPAGSEWKLAPGAAVDAALKLRTRPVPIPPKRSFWESTQALAVDAASRRAVVGYKMDDPKPIGSTRLVLVDLEGGKPLGTAFAPGQFVPTSLHDDGARVLMRRNEGPFGSNADRLEIWSLAATGIKKGLRWSPYDDLQGDARNVSFSEFVDADRLVTVNKAGKLACWGLDSVEKPLYWIQTQGESTPALSPDRKWIAFSTGKEVAVLDVAAGEVIASQPLPAANPAWPSFAFSASGKRLSCLAFDDKLWVWDVPTGAFYRGLTLHGLGNLMGKVVFPTDDQVLLGGKTLVDLDSQVRLWNYEGGEFVKRLGGLCWFEVSDGESKPGALVPVAIPQPAAKAALEKAMADPSFFVLKPGSTTVRVDSSALPDPAQRDKVRAALESKLRAGGFQVGQAGSIDLVATTEVGAQQQVHYRLWGGGLKSYDLRPFTSRLRFLSKGQAAWDNSSVHLPFMMNKDETQDSYRMRYERPNYDYFTGVELPKFLTRPTATGTVGTSRITTAGLK